MLKALTGEGILWLMRVCQAEWKFGKTLRDWQTDVIISIFKIASNVRITKGYHSLVCRRKYMPNALKEMPRNSEIKTGGWPVRFLTGSQNHGPDLHSEANLRKI